MDGSSHVKDRILKFPTALLSRCRIDARDKPVTKAQHSSDPGVFGPRALFRTTFPSPAVLVIDNIKRHDAATYRCRVDFRKGQTRSFRYNLTVIGEYHWLQKKILSITMFSDFPRYSRMFVIRPDIFINIVWLPHFYFHIFLFLFISLFRRIF